MHVLYLQPTQHTASKLYTFTSHKPLTIPLSHYSRNAELQWAKWPDIWKVDEGTPQSHENQYWQVLLYCRSIVRSPTVALTRPWLTWFPNMYTHKVGLNTKAKWEDQQEFRNIGWGRATKCHIKPQPTWPEYGNVKFYKSLQISPYKLFTNNQYFKEKKELQFPT